MNTAHAGFTCSEIQDRLVAYQDDELGRSECHLVEEHLDGCTDCVAWYDRLAAVTPEPDLVVPPELEVVLQQRISEALDVAEAHPRRVPQRGWLERTRRWLERETEVPFGALLMYAALLLLAIGWGATNWYSAATLRAQLQPTEVVDRADSPTTSDGVQIPAEQYKPASYQPEDDGVR